MKYHNEQLRDALAAEYALGTLQGSARRRFERSLKDDPTLRQSVAVWQARLAPLDALVEPVEPPARVWRSIQTRIELGSRRRALSRPQGFWANLRFLRGVAIASTVAALALAVSLVSIMPPARTAEMMVAVMSDDKSTPAMTVSWPMPRKGAARLRIHVIGHPAMQPGTAWELWMLPGGDQKPISLGLVGTEPNQELVVAQQLAPAINSASGLAMSVEPEGGSPTGLPTGPVIFKGPLTKL